MANLSAYIDFNITLTKSPSSSAILLSDPNDYPSGVAETLIGYFVIRQPDTITITGNYDDPDIEWNGTALTIASKQLRLNSVGNFQQGTYAITYYVEATGYDETALTKTFALSYDQLELTIADDFDVFTPSLTVTDETEYEQDGMTLDDVTRDWDATIISVEGTNRDITGSAETFELSYLGTFYDSQFDVTLTSIATYVLEDDDDWVTISDTVEVEETYYAFIPPTILELLELLTEYKATIDAANCICGTGCVGNCTELKSTYALAVSIYTHIVERGRNNQTDGLSAYVIQLQKLLNNCITPSYENTNEAISAYDWGGGSGGTDFAFYKQMIVGSGVNGAPADGATSYTDSDLIGKNVVVFLDSILMTVGLSDRVSISYNSTTGTITWNTTLAAPQAISIYTYE